MTNKESFTGSAATNDISPLFPPQGLGALLLEESCKIPIPSPANKLNPMKAGGGGGGGGTDSLLGCPQDFTVCFPHAEVLSEA